VISLRAVSPLALVVASLLFVTGCAVEVSGSPVSAVVTQTVTETVSAPDDDVPQYGTKVFDEAALEGDNGVKKILVENYNEPADEITGVDCPANQEVEQGATFECTVTVRDEQQTVKITVVNDDGQYEVSTPQGR
jgi:hypothetical protein